MNVRKILSLVIRLPPEPIIFLYFCCLSFQRFILPEYIYYSSCRLLQVGNCTNILNQNQSNPCANTSSNSINEIQAYSSYLSLVANLLFTVPTVLTILVAGSLSDVIGRKPILVIALIASIVSSVIFLLTYLFSLHPYFILLPEFIDGLGGNHQSVTIAVSSMVADLSSPKRRTFRLSIMEACILMGTFLFQVVSGYLLDFLGFLWSFVIIIIMFIITLLYILLVPESLAKSDRPSPHGLNKRAGSALKQCITPLYLFISNKNRLKFAIYLAVFGFIISDVVTTLNIFPLYALAPPLCWGPSKQGWYLGLTYLARCLGLYLFLPFLFKCGVPDNLLILVGIIDSALVYGLTGALHTAGGSWEWCLP